MAMTTTEMIEFFGQQAERTHRGMIAAQSSSNYQLAAVNCRQAFKCRLMQGMISWRASRNPTEFLASSVQGFKDDWNSMMVIGGEKATISDTPAERVPFISCLIGQCDLEGVRCKIDGLESDRLLDAVLGQWLYGSWNELQWKKGIDQLHRPGRELAYESYSVYRAIVCSSSSELSPLIERGNELFKRRQTDKFFCGGDQTEGGGDDNGFVVDYRLASIAKRVGYKGNGTNEWRW